MAIQLSSNFELNTQLPLDNRTVAADTTARDAIASINRYDGLIVYSIADEKNYQLQGGITNGDWVDLGSGGGGTPGGTGTNIQFRGGSSTFSGLTGSSVDNTQQTLALTSIYVTPPPITSLSFEIIYDDDGRFDNTKGAYGDNTIHNVQLQTYIGSIYSTTVAYGTDVSSLDDGRQYQIWWSWTTPGGVDGVVATAKSTGGFLVRGFNDNSTINPVPTDGSPLVDEDGDTWTYGPYPFVPIGGYVNALDVTGNITVESGGVMTSPAYNMQTGASAGYVIASDMAGNFSWNDPGTLGFLLGSDTGFVGAPWHLAYFSGENTVNDTSNFYYDGTNIILGGSGVPGRIDVTDSFTSYGLTNVFNTLPDASDRYGVVNIGTLWDGLATGHFAGNTQGTFLAINSTAGYTGSYIDIQVEGASQALFDSNSLHLTAIGFATNYKNITFSDTPYNALVQDTFITVNANDGNTEVVLPGGSFTGSLYHIQKTDSTANTVTIVGGGGELFNGAANVVLTTEWEEVYCQAYSGNYTALISGGSGGTLAVGDVVSGATDNRILYVDGSGELQTSNYMRFTDSTNRVVFGNNSTGNVFFAIFPPDLTISALDVAFQVNNRTLTIDTSYGLQKTVDLPTETLSINNGVTITDAATLYITGAPINTGEGTLTRSYQLWANGNDDKSRFDGPVGIYNINPSEVLSLGSSGKTGTIGFYGSSSGKVVLAAPTSGSADPTFVLPAADGTNAQVIQTDGSGNLSFVDQAGGTVDYTAEADADISEGQPVHVKSNGHVIPAKADSATTARVEGLAVADVTTGNICTYVNNTKFTLADWTAVVGGTTLVVGDVYYVSDSLTGILTSTAPTAGASFVVNVGTAVAQDTMSIELAQIILL